VSPFRSSHPLVFALAGVLLASGLIASGCAASPPVDAPARKAAAKSRLEAVVGPFPTAPAGGAAGARLREALQRVEVEASQRVPLRRLARQKESEWPAEDRASLEGLLAERASAFEQLRVAAAAEPDGLGISVPLPDGAFPDVRPLLDAARLLSLEGRAALRAGNAELAADDARTCMQLLRAARAEPWLLTQLLAGAAERASVELLAEDLAAGTGATESAFAEGLERLDSLPAVAWIAGEASLAVRAFDPSNERRPKEAIEMDPVLADLSLARMYTRYAELAAAVTAGRDALRDLSAQLRREEDQRKGAGGWLRLAFSPQRRGEILADSLADVLFASLIESADKDLAALPARRLALVAIAVARRGRGAGELPATIDGLDPSPSGEPVVYERRADGSARLALPRAGDEWKEHFSGAESVSGRFEWTIAAPRVAAGSPSAVGAGR
jgi:hypothetical protein